MNRDMEKATEFLYDLPRFTKKNSLAHTVKLMHLLGDPCTDRKVIHVAGSNGKGSVCCYLYNMIMEDGHTAAMFTSPHLVDIRERFLINGEMVSAEAFMSAYYRVTSAVEMLTESGEPHPTFFEFIYAMAMVMFDESGTEYIVLETGLGGRLDATNTFPAPVLCVITSISLEHTEILGDTIGQIAKEKAGIIKAGVPVVYAADERDAAYVISCRAEETGSPAFPVYTDSVGISEMKGNSIDFSYVSNYDNYNCDLKDKWHIFGCAAYQAKNAALAVEAARTLGIGDEVAVQRGLDAARWPGRMEEVLPEIYFDGAHNPSGMAAFMDSVKELVRDDAYPPILLFSMVKEKDLAASVSILTRDMVWDDIFVTFIPEERGTPADRLAAAFYEAGIKADIYPDCLTAMSGVRERKKPGQKVFCAGSLHFIGNLIKILDTAEDDHEF